MLLLHHHHHNAMVEHAKGHAGTCAVQLFSYSLNYNFIRAAAMVAVAIMIASQHSFSIVMMDRVRLDRGGGFGVVMCSRRVGPAAAYVQQPALDQYRRPSEQDSRASDRDYSRPSEQDYSRPSDQEFGRQSDRDYGQRSGDRLYGRSSGDPARARGRCRRLPPNSKSCYPSTTATGVVHKPS